VCDAKGRAVAFIQNRGTHETTCPRPQAGVGRTDLMSCSHGAGSRLSVIYGISLACS
jgi:hypothetical protein